MRLITWTFVVKWVLVLFTLSAIVIIADGNKRSRNHRMGLSSASLDNTETERRNRNHRSDNYLSDNDADELLEDLDPGEIINLSTNNEEIEALRQKQKRIDPKGSWFNFVRHSDERTTDKKPDRRKKKKRDRRNRSKMLHGPPGPVGPEGPPGPPGTSISKEEILADLQLLIKEATERRVAELLSEMVPDIMPSNVSSITVTDGTESVVNIPRIYAGFSMRLTSKALVLRKSFMELKSFQQPFGGGSFQRGDNFNAKEGRFIAPRDGVYQFTTNLHLKVRSKRKPKGRTKEDDHIRVVICIDSLCQTNTSIESITGDYMDKRIFTASVSGIVELKETQYVSVYVDNSSPQNIVVQSGSQFYGIFLGV